MNELGVHPVPRREVEPIWPYQTDLEALMVGSGFTPTQSKVEGPKLLAFATAMRDGTWDWERTRTDPRNRMMTDPDGNLLDGHHRSLAARYTKTRIPAGVVLVVPNLTSRRPRPWREVTVVDTRQD